jgi:fatty acid desaturase
MFAVLAAAHAAVLLTMPTATVIALGVWWNANTIAHNFIHRPFCRRRIANQAFAAALSVLNGIPQSFWRDRHLAHHARLRSRPTSVSYGAASRRNPHSPALSCEVVLQSALVLSVWVATAAHSPRFFLTTYVPGYLAGLALCALHGYYEHARGTTSYYGKLYNFLLFNDGYHVEHHANPGVAWRELPARRAPAAVTSRWPAPLRWMERASLDSLERLVLQSTTLQRFVVNRHARAWRGLLPSLPPVARLTIVGGGLFPRSALIARQLLPAAHITIVDASFENLQQARRLVDTANVAVVHKRYAGGECDGCDLLVIPLSFDGDRDAIYTNAPAPAVIVHDWIWRRRGTSRIVSLALLKRMNLVRRGLLFAAPVKPRRAQRPPSF